MKYLSREISLETATSIMKKVMGVPTKEIVGEEYDQLLLIFSFIEPVYVSNNQRSITEVYRHADKTYHVHYFSLNLDPIIEEVEIEKS